ncbi:hypothetical protein [Erwinia tracheiphila]|uniref:CPBP family intramembrane metalloprotease n=1 Tax=Erwinia tracheiphila TaxID=65700 RepID=A0A345CZQ8_9GAMM|nr:hypothetical protein AV903_25175 [Erwinia tracheiphila]
MVCFAALTGIIYGLAWLRSERVWVAALVHFAFSLLLFPYSVWQHSNAEGTANLCHA